VAEEVFNLSVELSHSGLYKKGEEEMVIPETPTKPSLLPIMNEKREMEKKIGEYQRTL
jgi:hypothetical protein